MTKNNTRLEYNWNKNFDSEGYKNEDMSDNESVVPVSYPDFIYWSFFSGS